MSCDFFVSVRKYFYCLRKTTDDRDINAVITDAIYID